MELGGEWTLCNAASNASSTDKQRNSEGKVQPWEGGVSSISKLLVKLRMDGSS